MRNDPEKCLVPGFCKLVALCLVLGLALPACDESTSPVADSGVKTDGKINTDGKVGQEAGKPDAATKLSHGILGQYSALTVAGGSFMASAYERLFGDLVYVSASLSAPGTLTKEIVDGVPNSTPTYETSGWRGGISDKGDDVGQDTDIIADSTGSPMISYLDATNRSLKFAAKVSGSWKSHVVDKPAGTKDVVGRYTSMVWSSGNPAIAYLVTGIADGKGNFTSELRWAAASKPQPTASTDWTTRVIESAAMSCQNLCASTEACVLNSSGTSTCMTKDSSCSKCATTQACVAGKCVTIVADSTTTDIPVASGLWPAALSTPSGDLAVYYDHVNGNLKAAIYAGGKWTAAVLKGTTKDKVGAFCAAAVDKSGTVHVSYQDLVKGTLHYLQLTPPTLTATLSETIDDGLRGSTGTHIVGADSVVHVDTTGTVRVLYQDQTSADLLAVKRGGPNSWTPNTTTDANLGRLLKGGAKGYGFYNDLAESSGKVYGSTFYYDAKANPEGSIEFLTTVP